MIGVKKNQRKLLQQIEEVMKESRQISSCYAEMQLNRGRTELRQVKVSDRTDFISKDWVGVKQFVRIHRIVRYKGQQSEEQAYFISSRKSNALLYAEGIRLHWQIENSLHYVKDVTWQEDASKIRTGNAPQNMSTLKNIAINILRNTESVNMAQAIRLVAHDISLLKKMIT